MAFLLLNRVQDMQRVVNPEQAAAPLCDPSAALPYSSYMGVLALRTTTQRRNRLTEHLEGYISLHIRLAN